MKKILSIALALVLMLSCFSATGVSAAEEFTPTEEPVIYFEVPENWASDVSKVFCHIWSYGGEAFANWASKKETCKKTDTEGLYSYDISKAGTIEDGKIYCIIFAVVTASGSELQTYNTLFDANCFGDTLFCNETIYENPEDSAKLCRAAFWKNQDETVYGPELQITSIGNIAGSALPPGVTAVDLMNTFITDGTLDNALLYVDKSAEELLTDIAEKLNVSDEDLADILTSLNPTTPDETTPDESTKDEGTIINLYLGDADCSGGTITVKDATIIQKHIAGFEVAIQLECADADQNDTVNVKDATTIQKFIAGLPVDAQIGLLIGTASDKINPSLDSRIVGSWDTTIDVADMLNMLLPMFSDNPLALEYINIETCPIKQIYIFNEDGTYTLIVDEAVLTETMASVKIELKSDIENFLKAYAEQNNLSMTPEQMMQTYGYESIDAFMDEMMPVDMIAESTAPQEGTYTAKDGILVMDENTLYYETYTIEGDTLTLTGNSDEMLSDMYPVVFTKVK